MIVRRGQGMVVHRSDAGPVRADPGAWGRRDAGPSSGSLNQMRSMILDGGVGQCSLTMLFEQPLTTSR